MTTSPSLLSGRLSALLAWLTYCPAHVVGEARQSHAVLCYAVLCGGYAHLSFVPLFFLTQISLLAYANLVSVSMFVLALWVLRSSANQPLVIFLSALEVIGHAYLATWHLGWDSGFHYHMLLLLGLFPLALFTWPMRIIGCLVILASYVGLWWLSTGCWSTTVHVSSSRGFFGVMNMSVFVLVLGTVTGYQGWLTQQARKELARELKRSESLLLNILPKVVADRLKTQHEIIADSFSSCSVLFADIVGFTPLSMRLAPEALVKLLNQIFTEFDILAGTYQVEKIKTIGDCYMVAAGIPIPMSSHAEQIARMALAMQQKIAEIAATQQEQLQLRIGLASGAAVAGVIGQRKFIYDLWGDTVNTASRMESHGVVGQIHVSAETAKLLKDKFLLEDRGMIEIKGKGMMQTYLLLGES